MCSRQRQLPFGSPNIFFFLGVAVAAQVEMKVKIFETKSLRLKRRASLSSINLRLFIPTKVGSNF